MSVAIVILCVLSAMLAITMLFARNPVTSAMCLLGVLIMTAGIYGLIGEHLVATIQLVVYAGAIMVLFVFSIMLLNLNNEDTDYLKHPGVFYSAILLGLVVFGFLMYGLNEHFMNHRMDYQHGQFTPDLIRELGGNSKVLAHALFSKFYVSFEVISLALLIAVVGAVVLAKRKFD
ncbi:MAG TPA: NADH-quinone oxidoreductase subunit J [Bacteriovoracaceae bacterium]|nr:NADH-quinone oxidoreductase subunit J [Bacteriovoracaceae bacterium]